jgi:hypothetical protein
MLTRTDIMIKKMYTKEKYNPEQYMLLEKIHGFLGVSANTIFVWVEKGDIALREDKGILHVPLREVIALRKAKNILDDFDTISGKYIRALDIQDLLGLPRATIIRWMEKDEGFTPYQKEATRYYTVADYLELKRRRNL